MILLDSDVLIDFLRGRTDARRLVEDASDAGEELATTALNVGEVLRGEADTLRAARVGEFLTSLTVLAIDERVARVYATVMSDLDRQGKRMPEIDAFIAAAALVNGASIATRNAKHFSRVPGLATSSP